MQKHKIMTDQKIGNLLLLALKIESQLKCILKNILPKNIKFYLNKPSSKTTNYLFNSKKNKDQLKMVKKYFSSYGNNIDNFSIGAISHLIHAINFINLVIKKHNYAFANNVQFIINNLNLICAIRNTLSHPKCQFNVSEKRFVTMLEPLKPNKNWNYQRIYKRLLMIKKNLNKIL